MPSPDGNFAFRKAQGVENIALVECKRLLIIFNRLVIDGKIPDSDA